MAGFHAMLCALGARFVASTVRFTLNHTATNAGATRIGQSGCLSADGRVALAGNQTVSVAGAANVGAAYAFRQVGSVWVQDAELLALDRDAEDRFACSLALNEDGTTALVGAYRAKGAGSTRVGAVYSLSRSGSSWGQESKFYALEPTTSFGISVDVTPDGSSAVVGSDSGGAYVFTRSGATWTQAAKLVSPTTTAQNYRSVAISADGNTAIALVSPGGVAAVFTRSGGTWTHQAALVSDGAFPYLTVAGVFVALSGDGDTAAVAADGCVYVFARNGATWAQQARLQAQSALTRGPVTVSGDGNTVMTSTSYIAVGSPTAVHLFTRSGLTWSERPPIGEPSPQAGSGFGEVVALSTDASTALATAGSRSVDGVGSVGASYVLGSPS